MLQFMTAAFAAFTLTMFMLGILPVRLPVRLMPVIVTAAGYGCLKLDEVHPFLVESAGIAGLVALVTRFAVSQLPNPVDVDEVIGSVLTLIPRKWLDNPWKKQIRQARHRMAAQPVRDLLPGRRHHIPRL